MVGWFLDLDWWKKIVYGILFIGIVGLIIWGLLSIPAYKGPGENCTFLNEKSNLHNEYYITVLDVRDKDSIFIQKNKDDLEKTELIGTSKHYIEVVVLIEHINVAKSEQAHKLDKDDFKIKDHTGIQIKNVNLFSTDGGLVLARKNFLTTKAMIDYTWFDTEILPGESKEITLYFEMSKGVSSLDTVIVLETDFFVGRGKNTGTDIVLGKRQE